MYVEPFYLILNINNNNYTWISYDDKKTNIITNKNNNS